MSEYLVRFSLRVSAESPGDAVDGVVDLFVEKGLRDWVYRVDEPGVQGPESLIGFFDGYGDPVDVEAFLAAGTESADPLPVPAIVDEPVESDDELLALAEDLNQSNDKPVPSNEELIDSSIRTE